MQYGSFSVPVIIVSEWEGPVVKTIVPDSIPRNAPVVSTQPSVPVKKKKKFSLGSAQIHVLECVDDNNNNAQTQENCWFKFLSVICAWRVRALNF